LNKAHLWLFLTALPQPYDAKTHYTPIMKENLMKRVIKFQNCDGLHKKIPSNGRELLGLVCTGEGTVQSA